MTHPTSATFDGLPANRPQRAFTLVELLVVIAIIGTLIGLLLPAVQSARETSRRTACSQAIRQLALGLHAYHDARRELPPAAANPTIHPQQLNGWSWMYMILPHIEQKPLFDALSLGTAVGGWSRTFTFISGSAATVARGSLAAFSCPSCLLAPLETQNAFNVPSVNGSYDSSKSNYLGNAGVYSTGQGTAALMAACSSGPLRHCDPIGFRDVKDGLSKTFLIGEAGGKADPLLPGAPDDKRQPGLWAGQNNTLQDNPASRTISRITRYKLNSGAYDAFGSSHPGGANFAMCDGSVVFIADTIESMGPELNGYFPATTANARTMESNLPGFGVYQRLSSRSDGTQSRVD
jgi:prepilin-type N-terminal cleavage/methylation domain-containing protein/prepilin-type processing-associated H-X9-DG protein